MAKAKTLKDIKVKTTKPDIDIICTECGVEKNAQKDFYISYNSKISIAPFCKECVIKNSLTEDGGAIDLDRFQNVLQRLDRPFLNQIYITSIKEAKGNPSGAVGLYMKNISQHQYRALRFFNSDFGHLEQAKEQEEKKKETPTIKKTTNELNEETREALLEKWGQYEDNELQRFEKKYQQMSKGYQILTTLHEEGLIDFCRLQCLYEMAVERKDMQEAKTFKALADDAKKNAKLNPLQLKKDDLQVGGVDSFAQMSDLIARRNGLINVPMEYLHKPQDILDYQLMENVNYIRSSFNMSELSYEEINSVYIDRIEKFNERYGADVMNNDFGSWGE